MARSAGGIVLNKLQFFKNVGYFELSLQQPLSHGFAVTAPLTQWSLEAVLPYSVLLALLQAVGAWLFVRALSVRWKNPYGQTLLYLLLLFSPISLTQLVTQRLYRMYRMTQAGV